MERTQSLSIQRVISGGQTGVDRGALDAAIEAAVDHGGWCPRGRIAEDGIIPPRYNLDEMVSPEYRERTEQNVVDSDATLILYRGKLQGGTELTRRLAKKHAKPNLLLDLRTEPSQSQVLQWISQYSIAVLNVAGPRESSAPGIETQSRDFMLRLLRDCNSPAASRTDK